jgi:hypothetical protein
MTAVAEWSGEWVDGLGVALNEATLTDVVVDVPARTVRVTLRVLTLPEGGPASEDFPVVLTLSPVGRIAASLRHGLWNDATAAVEPFPIEELSEVVRGLGGCEIYGGKFFDCGDEGFDTWAGRLSLDWHASEEDGRAHTLDLFQEGFEEEKNLHLDLRIGFDEMRLHTPTGTAIPVEEFIADGKRWWEAFFRNNGARM